MTRFVGIRVILLGTFCSLAACTCGKGQEPTPSTNAAAEAAPAAAAAAGDAAPSDGAPAVPPLSEEDLRIINADPATLTPEERRKRPYALRRKIMQNPDSPAAKSLEDLRKALEAGEIEPPNGLIKFEARGSNEALPSAGGPPPAGSRPAEPSSPPQ